MSKIFLGFLLLILVAVALPAAAMTEQERQQLIAQLQQQIQFLQQQIQQILSQQGMNSGGSQGAPSNWCHTFNSNLGYKQSGSAEVGYLRAALQLQGFSTGNDTGNTYGEGTATAVGAFQEKYAQEILYPFKLKQSTGFVGISTRAKLNHLYACQNQQIYCTQDVKQCSDGRYVTRIPPTCEFQACSGQQNNIACVQSWQCGLWSICQNGTQTRMCYDQSNCGFATGQPVTTQGCATTCSPDWKTGAWSVCSGGTQNRSAYDANNCGISSGRPISSQACSSSDDDINNDSGCNPIWQTGSWGSCLGGAQTRTVTDLHNCGVNTDKPVSSQVCDNENGDNNNTPCAPNWQCESWLNCANGQQNRYCHDVNYCGTEDGKPIESRSCSVDIACMPNWQTGSWSACVNGIKTRSVYDANNCGDNTDKPPVSQSCSSSDSSGSCQLSGTGFEAIKCVYGLTPYNTNTHMEMSYTELQQFLAPIASLENTYKPQEECGCGWNGAGISDPWRKATCIASPGAICDFSRVPDTLERRPFQDGCYAQSDVNPVEVSSRLAKGESLEQAYLNTIENQMRIIAIGQERSCIAEKVDEYYVGGEANSTSWMCSGDKYRLNPNVSYADWQKYVNGVWTSNFNSSICITDTGCVKNTCTSLSSGCGVHDDGCGGIVNCGICSLGYKCENGKCVNDPCKMIGENTCVTNRGYGQIYTYNNYCSNSSTYIKYYCGNSVIGYTCVANTYGCASGCSNGICSNPPGTPETY